LKHLGPCCIEYLTQLFNLSVSCTDLPAIWKAAAIVPVLKPGKPAGDSTSYHPISLLCPAAKTLERLLLPLITPALSENETQHGFAPGHSCTSALLPIATKVAIGFNDAKPARRSAMCAVDISKAFDCINHTLLIDQISSSDLYSNLVRWLAAYLRGRTASCVYRSKKSASMILHTGVPQGSVLSPALFNFFVSDCPNLADVLNSYADDFTVLESDADRDALSVKLQNSLTPIVKWASRKKLTIAPNKSQITLFTPWNRQFNVRPNISIDGVAVPLCKSPKTFDTMFSFKDHVAAIAAKATQRINILKAVCGTLCGHDKETLMITYKLCGCSLVPKLQALQRGKAAVHTELGFESGHWLP
jgi:hypothetical protein